jgi:hypothetical protein
MKHERLTAALLAMWPRGIPPEDYEAVGMLAGLVAAVTGPRLSAEAPKAKAKRKARRAKRSGPSWAEKIVGALKSAKAPLPLAGVVERIDGTKERVSGVLYDLHKRGLVKRDGERGSYAWRAA